MLRTTYWNRKTAGSHISMAPLQNQAYFSAMFSRFILLLLGSIYCLSGQTLKAQTLYEQKFYGPYIMLFQLDARQAAFAVNHQYQLDTAFLYTHPVGKIHADSAIPLQRPQLGDWPVKPHHDAVKYSAGFSQTGIWNIQRNGYFMEVKVTALNQVQYRLIEVPLFFSSVVRIGFETYVFVSDTAGLPVADATVHLDTQTCIYDQSIGGYRIKGNNISGTLHIEKGNSFVYYIVHGYNSVYNNSGPPKDNYQYKKIPFQGYLVTNKPKYKPGDTVFFKAYVVNKNAKPLKQKLIARMFQNTTGKAVEFNVVPDPKGAYNGHFVIGDSFNTDDYLQINLLTSKRQVVKSEVVGLENYELKDVAFSVTTNTYSISPGNRLKIFANATNKTGLPVMDGSITLVININGVEYADLDSMVISHKKWAEFYKITLQTDPSGTTIFDIPDSIFLPMKATFNIIATLTTGDNEIRSATNSFEYLTTRDRLETSLEKDTIKILHLYTMKSVRRKMRIQYYSRHDLIADSTIYTPFVQYITPNISNVRIYRSDTLVAVHDRAVLLPEITGKRSHDSAIIAFHSAKDIPVYYRIYRNNTLVASGKDTALHYAVRDKSKHSYHLQYGILAGSVVTPRFYSKSFHLKERELFVDIKQPKTIYPGQEVAVEIYVRDAYGKPVKKVNLTAYAVNTQLDGIKKPDVPYLGLDKLQKPLPTQQFNVTNCNFYHNSPVKNWHFSALSLYQNTVFHLLYPQKGFEVLRDTTPEHSTEIAFYDHSMGWQGQVQYVLKNDTLFASNFTTPWPRVLRIAPGKYDFTFRLFDRIVRMKDVEIQPGMKNFICLHSDSLRVRNYGDTISPGRFTPAEYAMVQKHTLLFRFDHWLADTLIVKVNGKTQFGFRAYENTSVLQSVVTQKPNFNQNTKRTEYINAQNFFALGPIAPGSTLEFIWKKGYAHQFTFTSWNSVSFTKNDAVILPVEHVNSGFEYFAKFQNNQYVLNTFWWDPDKNHVIPKPSENISQNYENVNTLPQFQYKDYSPHQYQHSSSLHLYIPDKFVAQKLWLFCMEDSSRSHLQSSSLYTTDYNYLRLRAHRYFHSFPLQKGRTKFLLVVQHNDTLWAVKPLDMDTSVSVFLTLKENEFRKLRTTEYITFDRMAKILGKEPYTRFEDTPTITKDLSMVRLKTKTGVTRLEGTVNGPDLNYVVDNAFVILEKNGFFIRGAITNAEGRFLMDSMDAGNYMLKIKGANYHYWISYNLQLDVGRLHVLHVKMRPYARYSYQTMVYDDAVVGDYDAVGNYGFGSAAGAAPSYYASPQMEYSDKDMMLNEVTISGKKKMRLSNMEFKPNKAVSNTYKLDIGDGGKFEDYEAPGTYQISLADSISIADPNSMAMDVKSRRLRREFRDHAYWIPNLQTDRSGYATYSVTYPDNITSWQTYLPAMDGKRHSGLGEMLVRSFKPVSSALALPYFLTEGDDLTAFGRIMNYTGKTVTGKYTLLVNNVGNPKNITIENYFSDSIFIHAKNPGDTIAVENGFEMASGYRDAQTRNVPVISAAVTGGKSDFYSLENDTTIWFTATTGDETNSVTIYNQQLAMVMEMLRSSDKILYPDNLSAADKLNALLIQKFVSQKLNIPFDKEADIHQVLKKLKNALKDNGTLGWYRNGATNPELTSYAAQVLYKAETMGYLNNGWLNIARHFERQLPSLFGKDALLALYTLKKLNRELRYKDLLVRIYPNELGFGDKLKHQWLLASLNGTADTKMVMENLHPSTTGDLYATDNTTLVRYNLFSDHAATTFLAWELLMQLNKEVHARQLLVSYLANGSSGRWHSSILAAECLVKEFEKEKKLDSALKPIVYVNDQLVAGYTLPKTFELKAGEKLKLSHSGAPVFVLQNRTFKTYTPVSDEKSFNITTSIGKHTDSFDLRAGKPVQMKVKVLARASHENVVVEIPIPAGCVYDRKIQQESPYEQHREYAYDRVYIYLEHMPFGYQEFTIPLVPKFNGRFTTAPSRAALMFYPDKAAYTGRKRFDIRD
jgi:hypothetical protein